MFSYVICAANSGSNQRVTFNRSDFIDNTRNLLYAPHSNVYISPRCLTVLKIIFKNELERPKIE
jgi:hypothetical protein